MADPTSTDRTGSGTEALRAARDLLLELRTDYDEALRSSSGPTSGESFNWAHDWFDTWARGNDAPGLVIVEEDGQRASYSFDELVRRSDQVATRLRHEGVGTGDSVIVMLGNQVELWETMLALIKLGAVVMPTTTAVGPNELVDRISRGRRPGGRLQRRRHREVRRGSRPTWSGSRSPRRARRRRRVAARTRRRTTCEHDAGPAPGQRAPTTGCSSTSPRAPRAGRSSSSTPTAATRSGTCRRCTGSGSSPGDVHLNISSPGWAKHAWSNFFAPWLAEATVLVFNYARFDAAALLEQLRSRGA